MIVGVNAHADRLSPRTCISSKSAKRSASARSTRSSQIKASRDARAVATALLAPATGSLDPSSDLMPPILDAVRAYGTIGEICGVLREVFGEYDACESGQPAVEEHRTS